MYKLKRFFWLINNGYQICFKIMSLSFMSVINIFVKERQKWPYHFGDPTRALIDQTFPHVIFDMKIPAQSTKNKQNFHIWNIKLKYCSNTIKRSCKSLQSCLMTGCFSLNIFYYLFLFENIVRRKTITSGIIHMIKVDSLIKHLG